MSWGSSIPKLAPGRGEGAPCRSPGPAMPWGQSGAAASPRLGARHEVSSSGIPSRRPLLSHLEAGAVCSLAELHFQATTRVFHPLLISGWFPPHSPPPVCPERGPAAPRSARDLSHDVPRGPQESLSC